MQPQLLDVLEVLVPYIDQQTALSLRLTCTTAASVCAAAVQELTYVLGTAAAASRCEDAAMHLALGFRAALGTFSSSNTLRLFCVLRRPADPAEASALFDALQHQGPGVAAAAVQATQTQQQQNAQEHVQDQQAGSSPLTGLRGLTLSEIKGQGSLQHSPVAAGMGVGAVLPYLPLLSAQLRSLHVKCLRAPSNISTVLPRLEHLTSLSLDSTSGFEPKVWKAVGQLRQLRQLSVVVEATPNLFLDWGRAETSAGLEHLVGLTELSLLKLTVVAFANPGMSLRVPPVLTTLQKLRHLSFCAIGGDLNVNLVGMPFAGQLRTLGLKDRANNRHEMAVQYERHMECIRQEAMAALNADAGDVGTDASISAAPEQPRARLRTELQRSLRSDTSVEVYPVRQFTQLTSLHWPEAYEGDGTDVGTNALVVMAAMSAPAAVAAALAALAPSDKGPWEPLDTFAEAYVAAAQQAAAASRRAGSHWTRHGGSGGGSGGNRAYIGCAGALAGRARRPAAYCQRCAGESHSSCRGVRQAGTAICQLWHPGFKACAPSVGHRLVCFTRRI